VEKECEELKGEILKLKNVEIENIKLLKILKSMT